MKTKTMALVVMMLCFLYLPVAHGADAAFYVNGKTILCTVADIQTSDSGSGEWWKFNLKYEFCNGNRATYSCTAFARPAFIPGTDVVCDPGPEPRAQDCNATRYTFVKEYNKKFVLYANTPNAQKYVCDELFKLMTVTVTPLK